MDSSFDPRLGPIIDEVLSQVRQGIQPDLESFLTPDENLNSRIRELIPALILVEEAQSQSQAASPKHRFVDANHTGRRIGDFEILSELGRGGMGVVYRARQVSLNRIVALKVLPQSPDFQGKSLERFQAEAQSAGKLHHTNIVPIFEFGSTDGVNYYAMQLIEGVAVDRLLGALIKGDTPRVVEATKQIERREPLAEPGNETPTIAFSRNRTTTWLKNVDESETVEALSEVMHVDHQNCVDRFNLPDPIRDANQYFRRVADVGKQVAEALEYSHRRGVIHRDIKPANLVLDWQGNIWVTDFGLAKSTGADLTATGEIVGTLRYMSPERLEGSDGPSCDVYSLGMTLYELTTLKPAFDDQDRVALMRRILTDAPQAPGVARSEMPRDLATIIEKAISREPENRYQSAGELAADLGRYLDGQPIRGRRLSPLARATYWARRNPLLAGLWMTIAVLLLTATIGSLMFSMTLQARNLEITSNLNRAQRAEKAKSEAARIAEERLYDAYLTQIQSNQMSLGQGRKYESLELIRLASDLAERVKGDRGRLRNMAIASMSMTDIEPGNSWPVDVDWDTCIQPGWDPALEFVAFVNRQGMCQVLNTRTGKTHAEISLPLSIPSHYSQLGLSIDAEYVAVKAYDTRFDSEQINNPERIWLVETATGIVLKDIPVVTNQNEAYGQFSCSGFFEIGGARKFVYACHKEVHIYDLDSQSDEFTMDIGQYCYSMDFCGATNQFLFNDTVQIAVLDLQHRKVLDRHELGNRSYLEVNQTISIRDAKFLPRSNQILIRYEKDFALLDRESFEMTRDFESIEHGIAQVAIHPIRHEIMASGAGVGATLLNLDSGEVMLNSAKRFYQFSADGRAIAWSSHNQVGVSKYSPSRGFQSLRKKHSRKSSYTAFDFTHDGSMMVASASNGKTTDLFAIENGRMIQEMATKYDFSHTARVPNQPNHFAISSWEMEPTMDVWQLEQNASEPFPDYQLNLVRELGRCHDVGFNHCFFDGGNRFLYVVGTEAEPVARVCRWPTMTTEHTLPWMGAMRLVQGTSNGEFFGATNPQLARVFDSHDRKMVFKFPAKARQDYKDGFRIRFSPDSQHMVLASSQWNRIYQVGSWELIHELPAIAPIVSCPDYSSDGRWLALTGPDFVWLYDAKNYELMAKLATAKRDKIGNKKMFNSGLLRFSPDGRCLAVSTVEVPQIFVWNIPQIEQQLQQWGLSWAATDSSSKEIETADE